jgi:hypothetical protein
MSLLCPCGNEIKNFPAYLEGVVPVKCQKCFENVVHAKERVAEKFCVGCNKYLPITKFGMRPERPDGRDKYCRDCKAEQSAARREKNKKHEEVT